MQPGRGAGPEFTSRRRRRRLLPVAVLAAIVGAGLPGVAHWLHWVGKPLATLLIIVEAWRQPRAPSPRYRRWLLAGLLASLLGDVWLMLPGDWFAAGLASFLLAHLAFLCALGQGVDWRARPGWRLPPLLYAALVLSLLWPGVPGELRVAVLCYVLVLASMAGQALVRAAALRGGPWGDAARRAALGALSFMLSDSLLAFDRFVQPLPWAALWVLPGYYLALWWLAGSLRAGAETSSVRRATC